MSASLALVACSSAETVELADAPDALGRAWCERLRECDLLGLAIFSQTTCEIGAYQYRNDLLSRLDAWVAGGVVRYDGEAMARCLDALDRAACVDLPVVLTDLPACADALAGTVAAGGACEGTLACAPGLYCEERATCPGTCQPRLGAGAACTTDRGCAAGLTCADGTCAAIATEGAPCESLGDCGRGLACDRPEGASGGTCRAITFALADGAPCDADAGQLCAPPLVCTYVDDAQGATGCRPASVAGGACRAAVPSPCPTGTVCAIAMGQAAGTCTALPGEGQPCLVTTGLVLTCGETLACVDGVCRRRADNGEACADDRQCVEDCVDGRCLAPACVD